MGIKLTRWFTAVLVGLLAGSLCYAAMTLDQIKLTGLGGSIKAPAIVSRSFIDVPVGPFVEVTSGSQTVSATTHYRGTIFVSVETGGDAATTYTLPTPSASLKGYYYYFYQTDDQNMVIQCATNDLIICTHADAADTATFSTASQKIGACALAICNGTNWLVIGINGTVTGAG